jgi:DNA-binding NtrC family response regulator
MPPAVLVVEDEVTLAKNICTYLQRNGFEAKAAGDADEALPLMESFKPEALVLDFNLPGGLDGLAVLKRVLQTDRHLKVIMLTGHGSIELAVEAMRAGAYDFLTKPVSLSKLKLLIEKALGEQQRDQALSYYQEREAAALAELIGESAAMLQLKGRLNQLLDAERHLAGADPPAVLILGETGTGKELVARAIHFAGPRAGKPFVELNCAALPAQLLESELFGYERGAFTDARERKPGLLEAADGGTLFLDEVADLEPAVQVKLLKMLEERTARRLGSVRDYRVAARIIAATNQSIETRVREQRFRSDLYFRLRVMELHVPPLRDRDQDVLVLARHFLALHGARYGKPALRFSPAVEAMLRNHRWPGNVRELRNVVEQAVLLAHREEIRPEDLSLCTALAVPPEDRGATEACRSCEEFPCESMRLDEVERDMLLRALRQTSWNVTQAARVLGVSRDTLRYRIEKYNLTRSS